MTNVNFFKLVKCQGQKIKYLQKDLITRDIHVKYQTLALTIQKLLARLNLKKKITLSGQGHGVKK